MLIICLHVHIAMSVCGLVGCSGSRLRWRQCSRARKRCYFSDAGATDVQDDTVSAIGQYLLV